MATLALAIPRRVAIAFLTRVTPGALAVTVPGNMALEAVLTRVALGALAATIIGHGMLATVPFDLEPTHVSI